MKMPERAWARYAFALAASMVAIALRFVIDRNSAPPVSPFIPGFAAVLASAAWAGPGAGTASTLFLTGFAAADWRSGGIPWSGTVVRCGFFLAEGIILSLGSARMLRSAREAAGSASWHRQLVETAGEGIWVRDGSGVITYANARLAEMLGVPPENLKGRKTEEFFFPEDLSSERIRMAVLTSESREQFDRRMRRADGSEIWVLACCNPMPDAGPPAGSLPGSLAMMTDITERKRAEHALRRSEERFRNLFEGVLEGVYQSTPEGRIIAANPMLLKMLGVTKESDLNDIHISRDLYVDPGIRRRLLEQLEREGSFQNVEYELRTQDNRIITVLENARVIRDEKGEVLYYEGTLTDISDRKRFEAQLRQAQKVEAMGRLASGIAQDFDTVLTVIAGHTKAALEELPVSHPARSATEQSLEAAERAMALTRQLVSFSRRPVEAEKPAHLDTVLLLEYEPLVRELSRDMLERQGYRVIQASDAGEAERIAGTFARFDLLIADITMPDMTGAELARRLRLIHPRLKVLFISGYTDAPMDREDLSGAGSATLQKPFSADSLGRKVRQMLTAE